MSTYRAERGRSTSASTNSTAFALASLLHDAGPVTIQASLFARYSALRYTPDTVGELLFNGIAQQAYQAATSPSAGKSRACTASSDAHTLRGGVIVSRDRSNSQTSSQVFPVDAAGNQAGQPITVVDNGAKTELTYSVYLQDEWKIADPLTVNFGGRFDHYDGFRSESQFSPRINAVLTPAKGLTLHAGYARYFSPAPFSNVASTSVAEISRHQRTGAGRRRRQPAARSRTLCRAAGLFRYRRAAETGQLHDRRRRLSPPLDQPRG